MDAALSILLQHDLESRLPERKAFLKECSIDGAMQRVLEQIAREVGEGSAWVRDQLPKSEKLEEAQREMIRKEISKLAAEESSPGSAGGVCRYGKKVVTIC